MQAGDVGLVAHGGDGQDGRVLARGGVNAGALADLEALGDVAVQHVGLERPRDLDAAPAGRGLAHGSDCAAGLETGDDGRLRVGLDEYGGVGRERVGGEAGDGEDEGSCYAKATQDNEEGFSFHRGQSPPVGGNEREGP